MPEDTQPASNETTKSNNKTESSLHTCACGEQHEDLPGSPSHRDACTSTLKFGDSCCCGSGEAAKEARHRCGHGPRCR
ncbi:MAG: hypothetical protein CVV30_06780 [Methanomicrobiales archaeon HGW-Methanomicrobiales-1]|nr:MAG: hypothetical protein CVV30_06780 [Methanomicrobiales archaeon HGW-Methanomicrobiales-1]